MKSEKTGNTVMIIRSYAADEFKMNAELSLTLRIWNNDPSVLNALQPVLVAGNLQASHRMKLTE